MINVDFIVFNKEDFDFGPQEWLGVGYLSSSLKNNLNATTNVSFYKRTEIEKAVNETIERKPKIIGLSILQINYIASIEFIKIIKSILSDVHIVIGNREPTHHALKMLELYPEIDSVIIGEGEITICELVSRVAEGRTLAGCKGVAYRDGDGIHMNQEREIIKNLDEISFPDRSYLDKNNYTHYMITSRGCKGACTFCGVQTHNANARMRVRSMDNIIEEIKLMWENNNLKYLVIADSTFCHNVIPIEDWYNEFYDRLIETGINIRFSFNIRAEMVNDKTIDSIIKLMSVGLDRLFIGIESGNEADLKLYNKIADINDNVKAINLLLKNDVPIDYGFIMFNPYSTFAKLRKNVEFIRTTGLYPFFNKLASGLYIHSGTPLVEKLKQDGLLETDSSNPISNRWAYRFVDERIAKAFWALKKISTEIYPVTRESILKCQSLLRHCMTFPNIQNKKAFQTYQKAFTKFIEKSKEINLDIVTKVIDEAEAGIDPQLVIMDDLETLINNISLDWVELNEHRNTLAVLLEREKIRHKEVL